MEFVDTGHFSHDFNVPRNFSKTLDVTNNQQTTGRQLAVRESALEKYSAANTTSLQLFLTILLYKPFNKLEQSFENNAKRLFVTCHDRI